MELQGFSGSRFALQDISLFPFGFGQRAEKIAHIRLVSRMAASLALDAAAVYVMYYIR